MYYLRFKIVEFFQEIDTEEKARELFWKAKFGEKGFECTRCFHTQFYSFETRPERRRCRQCGQDSRLRPNTMLAHSKLPVLVWARLIFLMLHDKRGISALHAQRTLKLKSYATTWGMLHKIRRALAQRSVFAQRFVDKAIKPSSHVITDGGNALRSLKRVESERQVMHALPEQLDRYLPWSHRLIANAKTWLQGTHHGIKAKYLNAYLAETIYRFNRRHDPDSLFHRAFTACAKATPITLGALSR